MATMSDIDADKRVLDHGFPGRANPDRRMPVRRTDLLEVSFGLDVGLYDENAKRVHVLNATAKFVWDRCDGASTISQVAQLLKSNYALRENQDIYGDIEQILDRFEREGLF